jgi:hypothetical protein
LVAFFDCLHEMGDPVGAGKNVKETLAKDGSWMVVEPFAHDNLKDNLNPVGCIFYHGVDLHLHTGIAVSGSGPRARCPGRRIQVASGRHGSRFQEFSTCYRDAI